MSAIVTNKTRLNNARNFIEAFSEKNPDNSYLFIGRESAWPDDASPPDPDDSVLGEIQIYNEALAYKKITPANISRVIKRFDWTSGQRYDPYDDTEKDVVNRSNPLYVLTDEGNIYKCIDRPANTDSTTKPKGQSLSVIENSGAGEDGYKWKFMYDLSITQLNKFLNDQWIPVENLQKDDGSVQWTVQQSAIEGGIHRIRMKPDGFGSGYTTATITIDPPVSGTQAKASADIVGGAIVAIHITDPGSGYRDYPKINISGDGDGNAAAEAVLSPRGGHGTNPVEELNGIYAMILSELEDTEGGTFPVNKEFRRTAILTNPRLENEFGIELNIFDPGKNRTYAVGDTIESDSGATAEVIKWDYPYNLLTVKNVTGTFQSGEGITNNNGVTSSITGINTNVNLPATKLSYSASDIKNEVGDIIYVENRVPIQRNNSQTEQIRLVIEF